MIKLECPRISLGRRTVLHDVRFAARSGKLVALSRPNGAGKSTLLRSLARLMPDMPARDPRRVAYLPQGRAGPGD
jgi:ABC-type cobalamin/Fe3+-siderophores transport system ATPase subunit